MRHPAIIATCVAAGLWACTSPPDSEDGADDAIGVGKADAAFSAAELAGALQAANELSLEELDDDVGLSSRAAENIVAARPLASVEDLDAVRYVGPYAFGRLVEFARDAGWIRVLPPTVSIGAGGGQQLAATEKYLAVCQEPGLGTVSMFERDVDHWRPTGHLAEPTSPYPFTTFASRLELDGDTLVVTGNNPEPGTLAHARAYVYERSATGVWQMTQELPAGDGGVAIEGDLLAVGDVRTWIDEPLGGVVRLYRRSSQGWTEIASLSSSGDRFGKNLALHDGMLAIGADEGGAYVVDVEGSLAAGVPLADSMQHLDTGADMAMNLVVSRDLVAVSNWQATGDRVHVFQRSGSSGWEAGATLTAPPSVPVSTDAYFGRGLALDGSVIVVGAPGVGKVSSWTLRAQGAVYAFDTDGTLLEEKLGSESDPGSFGTDIAIAGDRVVVGAYARSYSN